MSTRQPRQEKNYSVRFRCVLNCITSKHVDDNRVKILSRIGWGGVREESLCFACVCVTEKESVYINSWYIVGIYIYSILIIL